MIIFIFAGCGNKISEKQLKSELETNSKYSFLSNDETITDIIIEKSELNDDKKTEIISTQYSEITLASMAVSEKDEANVLN